MKIIPRIFTLLLCAALVAPRCVTTEFIGPEGELIIHRGVDTANVREAWLFALEALDLIIVRIAAYEALGEDISPPDALELAIAEARETLLRRAIDYIDRQFEQMAPGTKKIRLPVGLFRELGTAVTAETGKTMKISAVFGDVRPIGINIALRAHPEETGGVSPNDLPWNFAAAGFDSIR